MSNYLFSVIENSWICFMEEILFFSVCSDAGALTIGHLSLLNDVYALFSNF